MIHDNDLKKADSLTDFIELRDSTNHSYARIYPNQGGCLQELVLDGHTIIEQMDPVMSTDFFASSILFPFTGRVKNNSYSFDGNVYKLDVNLKDERNALHGMVYNKPFEIIENSQTEIGSHLILRFSETDKNEGFPFTYSLQLHYELSKDNLKLEVTVQNTGLQSFPYSIGWHPYFYSRDLYNSYLILNSDRKISFNEEMIPIEILDYKTEENLQIKDKAFDDCYILNNKNVHFKTPDHNIEISSSSKENYLQVFTPKTPNAIALEPITGPSNSLNNKLGLQVLMPNETNNISWNIKLKNDER